MSDNSYKELLTFLGPQNRRDIRLGALSILLKTTADIDGRQNWYKSCPEAIETLMICLQDADPVIAKSSFSFLINISSDRDGAELILKNEFDDTPSEVKSCRTNSVLSQLFDNVLDPESVVADHASSILANLSRYPVPTDQIHDFIQANEEKYSLQNLVSAFTKINYNTAKCSLDTLAFFFANLSQSAKLRKMFLNRKENIIRSFLSFVGYEKSEIRKSGVVTLIKNCCFDQEHHEWLLSPEVEILPHLLLPLAGPEQFDDEDNEKLPVDLQYLPETKMREPNPSIRKCLLEALLKLCATKTCRTILRDCNTYIILRELHKWEKDSETLLACENVVDILIRTEEEIGIENLLEVEVPSDLKEKFEKLTVESLNDQ
nr:PREDICTED: protein HGH1 homolog [Bemisia tabaci]